MKFDQAKQHLTNGQDDRLFRRKGWSNKNVIMGATPSADLQAKRRGAPTELHPQAGGHPEVTFYEHTRDGLIRRSDWTLQKKDLTLSDWEEVVLVPEDQDGGIRLVTKA